MEKVWHLHTMESHSATRKNETMPLAATWRDPERVGLSEVSPRKTDATRHHFYADCRL